MKRRQDDTGPGALRRADPETLEAPFFGAEDRSRVLDVLSHYAKSAEARCAALVDDEGRVIAHAGGDGDAADVARLAASSFDTAKIMRGLFGREEIVRLFRDRWVAVEMSIVADGTMLAALFGERTTLSMVRSCGRQAAARLREIVGEIRGRPGP